MKTLNRALEVETEALKEVQSDIFQISEANKKR
jgi:hypothetical protein